MILKSLQLHSPKGSYNFENSQNHSYPIITKCTRGRAISYTNKKMKKFAQKKCRKIFLEAIFLAFFQSVRTNFLSLLYVVSLAYKIPHCLSANHNPELRGVICTGVTLFAPVLHFALVLHLNCTALSQWESSNFFICIINEKCNTPFRLRAEFLNSNPAYIIVLLFIFSLFFILLTNVPIKLCWRK